ncbi:M23 family metallopeptidase [Rothia uropygioeca]|uniref:M23 family metallopeptidase n=1 Tax=Kocuria sp. 257 TaxID=2021970 RepID=UPI0010107A59|nr:M23 family metallopeptidase [Kocuria sp. 257]
MNTILALVLAAVLGGAHELAIPARAPSWVPRWVWPTSPAPAVERKFEKPARKWDPGHRGVDLAVKPGQTIRSPASGTVTFSGRVVDRGVITVTTDDGYLTSFEPVTEQLPRGTRVSSGDVIARRDWEQSHEGCSSCLHWGVRHGGDYVNPLLLVGALSPSVLWPLPRGPDL